MRPGDEGAAGPSALDIVHSAEPIDLLAELGIAVLLFLVGIKLDAELIRTLGPVSLATGLGQVGLTSLIGFGAQISECSLILMAMGVSIGHVSEGALGLVTLVGLITIAASTYLITYSHQLYALCEPFLRGVERGGWREAGAAPSDRAPEIIVLGLGRYGGALMRRLALRGYRVLGVNSARSQCAAGGARASTPSTATPRIRS